MKYKTTELKYIYIYIYFIYIYTYIFVSLGASTLSVLAPTVSHSQPPPLQEALQYLYISLWTHYGH